jgi:ADP-ribose pyrophosphatase YjhB (NUDIX family)
MSYLCTITDEDVFKIPKFRKPDTFKKRITVKAIVRNSEGQFALVTNDVHGIYLLPGGGTETNNLEDEISRECKEEIGYSIELSGEVGKTHEFRNRNAKEYFTTCYIAEVKNKLTEDMRTAEEQKNDLRVEWLDEDDVIRIFTKQKEAVRKGEVEFYNTAFNILRDGIFIEKYLLDR